MPIFPYYKTYFTSYHHSKLEIQSSPRGMQKKRLLKLNYLQHCWSVTNHVS